MVFQMILVSLVLIFTGLVLGGIAYLSSMMALTRVFDGIDEYSPMFVGGGVLLLCLFIYHGFSIQSFTESAINYSDSFMGPFFYIFFHVTLTVGVYFGLRITKFYSFR